MTARTNRWLLNACRATFAAGCLLPDGPALAQSQARDMDAAVELSIRVAAGDDRHAAFIGSAGFLDYEHPAEATPGPHAALFSPTQDEPEPPESLLPYQSRGQRVTINWGFLDGLMDGSEARAWMPLFDGQGWELVFSRSEYRSATRYSWFGQIAGVAASDFNLVRYDDVVYMRINDYEHRKEYQIQFAAGYAGLPAAHVLRKTGDIRPEVVCGTCGSEDVPATRTPPPSGGYSGRDATDPVDTVDVMIFCTVQARLALVNDSNFYANAQACIDDANLRNRNSGTGLTLRLMYASPSDAAYSEDTSGAVDLNRLGDPSDGFMDNLPALRDAYRADLVALLRSSSWGCSGSSCTFGRGHRPASMPAPDLAFTVNTVSGGSLPHTFSHEIGHNLGACHDAAHGGCSSPDYGVTASPNGYTHSCDIGICTLRWDTTMAYNTVSSCDSSTPIPYYSNPAVQFDPPGACGPAPIGDATANVSGLINITRSSVSQYRIGSTQVWASWDLLPGGNGTRHSPYSRLFLAARQVRGGAAAGVVKALSGTYDETFGGTVPVSLANPCVLQSADGGNVVMR